ncbi:hypothetical protein NFI96_028957, partial [Prochilodus magdalenae]
HYIFVITYNYQYLLLSLTENTSELRIILLGSSDAGKSSAGNTILNREEFELKRTAQCVKRQGEVAGRHITVVEAPGWWSDTPVKESTELLKQETVLSVSLCPPGPHAVLLILRLDNMFKEDERTVTLGHLKLLTDTVWSHTVVLFTCGDWLGDTPIEQHIESEGKELQWLVEKCGNRYHVLNNKNRSDDTQVTELLEKIEEMVAANCGRHFEMDRKILQEVVEKRRAEEARAKERRMKLAKQKEDLRSLIRYVPNLPELRIVVLGYRNAGKSSAGNTILNREEFELTRTAQCVKRQGEVAGRHITVVEAPGWCNRVVEENTELLKQEIVLSVSLCSLDPHCLLLVIRVDIVFKENEGHILNGYMKLFSQRVWNHTIVLFTFGDYLGDTPIEQHIESEGKTLQWLVEKCRNRYHVLNNKNRSDDTQVTELLEKIEEMVAANGGCDFRIGRKVLQTLEEIVEKQGKNVKGSVVRENVKAAAHDVADSAYSSLHPDSTEYRTSCSTDSSLTPGNNSLKVPDKHEVKKFLCLHDGQFQCKITNLVFEMEGHGEVLYRIDYWDTRLLVSLGQMEPAGPLYLIECLEGSVSHLHLPHCEILSGESQHELAVAHFTGDNIEVISPLLVTDTHVVISIQGLSLFSLLKNMIFYPSPINAQVLLFYKEIRGKQSKKKLHIHLLPRNVPVEEKANFECDYGPNYHPTFEVFIEAEDVTVSLLDEDGEEVWEPHQILLSVVKFTICISAAEFVDDHRGQLIQRVSSVMELADSLQSKKMIGDEMYNNIKVAKTSQEQMRILYDVLQSGGTAVKAEFYEVLKLQQHCLVEELEAEPRKA